MNHITFWRDQLEIERDACPLDVVNLTTESLCETRMAVCTLACPWGPESGSQVWEMQGCKHRPAPKGVVRS